MTTVKCTRGDAPQPKQLGGLLLLGAPFEGKLVSGDKLSFKMGVTFDVPVILMAYPFTTDEGVVVKNDGALVLPGKEVIVNLEMTGIDGATTYFERGRTLVCAVPLVDSFSLE